MIVYFSIILDVGSANKMQRTWWIYYDSTFKINNHKIGMRVSWWISTLLVDSTQQMQTHFKYWEMNWWRRLEGRRTKLFGHIIYEWEEFALIKSVSTSCGNSKQCKEWNQFCFVLLECQIQFQFTFKPTISNPIQHMVDGIFNYLNAYIVLWCL